MLLLPPPRLNKRVIIKIKKNLLHIIIIIESDAAAHCASAYVVHSFFCCCCDNDEHVHNTKVSMLCNSFCSTTTTTTKADIYMRQHKFSIGDMLMSALCIATRIDLIYMQLVLDLIVRVTLKNFIYLYLYILRSRYGLARDLMVFSSNVSKLVFYSFDAIVEENKNKLIRKNRKRSRKKLYIFLLYLHITLSICLIFT